MPHECLCEAGPTAPSHQLAACFCKSHIGPPRHTPSFRSVWAALSFSDQRTDWSNCTEIVWPPELERVPIWPFVGNICQPLKGSYITVRRKEKGGEARLLEGFMRSGGEFGSSFYHAHAAKGTCWNSPSSDQHSLLTGDF